MLPIIDVLSNAFSRNDLTVFDHLQTHRAEECAQLRILFCTQEPSAVALDLAVELSSSVNITSYFKGPRAWVFSKQTGKQQPSQGPSSHAMEYVFGVDTEFALAMADFIYQQNTRHYDRRSVIDVLQLKSHYANCRFDVTPILYEQMQDDQKSGNQKTMINALTCIKMLEHVDWDRFRNHPEQLHFTTPLQTLKQRLEPGIPTFLSSSMSSTLVNQQNTLCQLNQAVLLRFTRLWAELPNQSSDRVLNRLLAWCLNQFGFLPMQILSLLWCGVLRKDTSPFFEALINPDSKLFQSIKTMAWQITHLRWFEEAAALSRQGPFILPYCVSWHDNWHQLLNLNPVQCMLIDGENAITHFIRVHERAFHDVVFSCLDNRYKKGTNLRDFESKKQEEAALSALQLHQIINDEKRYLLSLRA